MKHRVKTVLLIGLALIALFGMTACPNSAGGSTPPPVQMYKVELDHTIGGNVKVTPALSDDGMAAENTELTFTATPLGGYILEKWELNGTAVNGTELTYTLKVTANAQVKVFFKRKAGMFPVLYTVTLTPPVHGRVTTVPELPNPPNVPYGSEITFKAVPDAGYAVDKWTVSAGSFLLGGTDGSTSATLKITEDVTVTVTFKQVQFKIDFGVDGGNGTLTAKVDGSEISSGDMVEHGKTVVFKATPNSGYKVKEWKVGNDVVTGNTSNTYTCTVTKAVHVTVSFAPPDVGSFEDAGDGFIKITPPANGIAGVAPDYALPEDEAGWKGVFIKDRKVKLSPYKLGKTEVTYEVWHEVLTWAKSNGYTFANKGKEGSGGTEGAAPTDTGKKEPVTTISWRDCIVWCNAYTEMKLGSDEQCVYRESKTDPTVLKNAKAKDGEEYICDKAYADMSKKGFRLPTEAEWEYAARWQGSDTTNAAQYGEVWLTKLNSASGAKDKWDTAETGAVAWYDGNSGGKTHPVGERRANALGLHDMSGNVWEWCFDWHDDDPTSNDDAYKQDGIVTDPQGGASGSYRVRRGNSWNLYVYFCTVGKRGNNSPDGRGNDLGFRLACRP